MRHASLKRFFAFAFTLLILLQSTITPASAQETVTIETLIDKGTNSYITNIRPDSALTNGGKYGNKYFTFSHLATISTLDMDELNKDPSLLYASTYAQNKLKIIESGIDISGNPRTEADRKNAYSSLSGTDSSASNKYMHFSYPSYGGGAFGDGNANVTAEQETYAKRVAQTLGTSLNTIIATANKGKRMDSVDKLIKASLAIRPASTSGGNGVAVNVNGYTIYYFTTVQESPISITAAKNNNANNTKHPAKYFPHNDEDGNLYALIYEELKDRDGDGNIDNYPEPSEVTAVIWAMPKGFAPTIAGQEPLFTDGNKEYSWVDDGPELAWITVHDLAIYANVLYKCEGITTGNMEEELGVVEGTLSNLVVNAINGIESFLGLKDPADLIYNRGAAASAENNYGALSNNWWSVALKYHMIFQCVAWFAIVIAFLKMLIQLNLSTINPSPQTRLSVYETIQKFLVTGACLVLVVPASHLLFQLNDTIVQIFASQMGENLLSGAEGGGIWARLTATFLYFGITLNINFTYIIRSVFIALLIATAPLFISTMAFNSRGRNQLATKWAQELIANIFLQSIHAISYAFLSAIIATAGTNIERMVILYSLIPITEVFRALIFGQAGAAAGQVASQTQGQMTTMAAGVANGMSKALSKKTAGEINSSPGGDAEGSSSSESGGTSTKADGNTATGAEINALGTKANKLREQLRTGGNTTAEGKKLSTGQKAGLTTAGRFGLGVLGGGASITGGMLLASSGAATNDRHLMNMGAMGIGGGIAADGIAGYRAAQDMKANHDAKKEYENNSMKEMQVSDFMGEDGKPIEGATGVEALMQAHHQAVLSGKEADIKDTKNALDDAGIRNIKPIMDSDGKTITGYSYSGAMNSPMASNLSNIRYKADGTAVGVFRQQGAQISADKSVTYPVSKNDIGALMNEAGSGWTKQQLDSEIAASGSNGLKLNSYTSIKRDSTTGNYSVTLHSKELSAATGLTPTCACKGGAGYTLSGTGKAITKFNSNPFSKVPAPSTSDIPEKNDEKNEERDPDTY